jgi:hypothetical protein
MVKNEIKTIFRTTEDLIIEEIYKPDNSEFLFAVYDGEEVKFKEKVEIGEETYVPLKSPLIEKSAVLLPSGVEEYHSTAVLIDEIRSFIHKYYEYPKVFEDLDPYYVLHTWNYDKFSVTPYRRVLGDYGTGKSRFLRVLGSICYRPFFSSSASSIASVYRMIDRFHGTVIIDEADFYSTNYHADIVKILNCGYQKGTPIFKCELETFNPQAFNVYCPKIVASRERYEDPALESRFITHETDICTRTDIPTNLPLEFHEEAKNLRNKLLFWRLRNYRKKAEPDVELKKINVEPRLIEIMTPLSSIIEGNTDRSKLRKLIRQYQKDIIRERGLGQAKFVLESIIILYEDGEPLSVGNIAAHVRERLGIEDPNNLSAKRVGSIIKRDLRLKKDRRKVGNNVPIVVIWDTQKIQRLCVKYGLDFNDLTSLTSPRDTNTPEKGDTSIERFLPLDSKNHDSDTEDFGPTP